MRLKLDRRTFNSLSRKATITLRLARSRVKAQIEMIDETHKEFERLHQEYEMYCQILYSRKGKQ